MVNDELITKCEHCLINKGIKLTSIRIEILSHFLLHEDERYTIKELYQTLILSKQIIGISTVAEILTTFKEHGILKAEVENSIVRTLLRQRGRPSIKYFLSHEFHTKKEK